MISRYVALPTASNLLSSKVGIRAGSEDSSRPHGMNLPLLEIHSVRVLLLDLILRFDIGRFFSYWLRTCKAMKSSKPGAENMNTRLMTSLPMLKTKIHVPAGMNMVGPQLWRTSHPSEHHGLLDALKNNMLMPRPQERTPTTKSRSNRL
jgi:hypothetical protein